jgi:microcin C transport system substrate-binding protein
MNPSRKPASGAGGNGFLRAFNSRALHPKHMAAALMAGFIAGVSLPAPAKAAEPAARAAQAGAVQRKTQAHASGARAPEQPQHILRSHALTVFGAPKYGPDFRHFDYVNPAAPKGGTLSTGANGGFDSLNPFIIRGNPAENLMLVYDTLMTPSTDETGTVYGLIAESVELPEDKSWIVFHLRPEARWQDGAAVTAEDVKWSYETLRDEATPSFKSSWQDVSGVEIIDAHTIKFTFSRPDARLSLLALAEMPVLPKHYWEHVETKFRDNTNALPLGSGPYRVSEVELGRDIVYERNKDWWGKDLPVNRGRYNFDKIKIEYFRDETANLEAFARGLYNFRQENTASRWAVVYNDMPDVANGKIVREEYPNDLPAGMQAFVFNTRRGAFRDRRVREAMEILFNFEWLNRVMAYDAYTRSTSFFANSDLASKGPPTGRELEILERFRGRIPDSVFTDGDRPPVYEDFRSGNAARADGKVTERQMLRRAFNLLRDAGYVIRDGKMVDARTGRQLGFELLITMPGFERWAQPYFAVIRRLGIAPVLRVVDSSQYINRIQSFDYDMVVGVFRQPMTPGPEQRNFWHSSAASQPGSANLAGIKDPVVDELVEMMQNAGSREELQAVAHALDRVLLSGYYVVPHYHTGKFRIAYRSEIKRPQEHTRPRYDLGVYSDWWYDARKPAPAPKPGQGG